ncbi:MAG: Error-prone repair protein ImuA [Flavipsychrobacter sp.]
MERAKVITPIGYSSSKSGLIEKLQQEVYALQRFKKTKSDVPELGLGPIADAFPQNSFPIGAIHEFISYKVADAAATTGFIVALAGRLMQQQGTCLWVSTRRTLYPPSLKQYGLDASRVICVDLSRQKDVLWAVEEALKCQSLSLVIGELSDMNFNDSRRLQLAVEQSNVTGLLHRYNPRSENTLATVARWKITSLPSHNDTTVPGMGFSQWHVQLSKVRNGKPNSWDVQWSAKGFQHLLPKTDKTQIQKRKTA